MIMCGYRFPKSGKFCERRNAFWVQSLLSTHNQHACPHHLARIVAEVEDMAYRHDITNPQRDDRPHPAYVRDGKPARLTSPDANYARVTVKPMG